MNPNQENYLRYCKNILELSRLQAVEYSKKTGAFWVLSTEVIKSGILPPKYTNEIFEEYFSKSIIPKKKREGTSSINLIISPQAIKNGGRAFGALNLACSLSKETGELAADLANGGVWIPKERLTTPNTEPMDIMVGSLKDYREFIHENKEELESKCEVWTDYLAYADSLFEHVNKSSFKPEEGSFEEYTSNKVYLTIGQGSPTNAPVVALYDSLLRQKEMPRILETMLKPTRMSEKKPANLINQNEQMENNMIAFCGNMGKEHPLADSQRNAVYAYTRAKEDEILAVSGPPGTGKTTMLQAIAANLITTHAIDEKIAPIIIGTSATNQAVTNIIDSFSVVTPKSHGPLDFRWLIARDNTDSTQNEPSDKRQTLSGIAAYCPGITHLKEAKENGYLVEQSDKSGVYSEYSNKDYQKEAEIELFEFAKTLLEKQFSNLKDLQSFLHSALIRLDNTRIELIRSAAAIVSQKKSLPSEEQYNVTEAKKLSAQSNLKYWMKIEENRPMNRFLFCSWPTSKDEDLIYANKQAADFFPNTITTLEGVKEYYKQQMNYHEQTAASILQARTEYVRNEQNYASSLEAIKKISFDLAKDEKLLKAFEDIDIHSGETLLNLDKALDTSVRYVEFWLSIHYYECQWLIDCSSQSNLIPKKDRWQDKKEYQKKYWEQIPSLTPCLVMTEFQLPKYFTLYGGKELPKRHDFGRIDLLIVDEAGQVDTPLAFASFALAKKAVVVGDTNQLSPIWTFTSNSDRETALDKGVLEDDWREYGFHGLTASKPSSLMHAAANACCWCYSNENAGLFLKEHYRCVPRIIQLSNNLIYGNRLVPSRQKSSKLEGLVDSPFMYHVVPDSKDTPSGSSRKNQAEADAIVEWIKSNSDALLNAYKPKQNELELKEPELKDIIGIVTPFSAQANLIKSKLQEYNQELAKSLTIGTAHKLQGAERPVILFSVVYGNEADEAGFMERTPELTNVAVSRAKDLFIAFGSEKRLEDSGEVLRAIKEVAVIGDGNVADSPDYCPEG